jgi:hypothetical protein
VGSAAGESGEDPPMCSAYELRGDILKGKGALTLWCQE